MKQISNRNSKIIAWNEKGLTQTAIAIKLGITRQRVQQIEKALGVIRERKASSATKYNFICEQCGQEFTYHKPDRKFCSRECFHISRVTAVSEEEREERMERRRLKNKAKSNHYYHHVFKKKAGWKKIVKERNLARVNKNASQTPHQQTTA